MYTVSFTRNVFIPLTNICRNRCAYCGFRGVPGDGGWFLEPPEVELLAKKARGFDCIEALITTGEKPEVFKEVSQKLAALGYRSFSEYVESVCKRLLEMGLLPHVNLGVMERTTLRRLRRVCVSMGLMLECKAELPAHRESPGKAPELRLKTIEVAGELRIPFTTGLLVGIGEREKDRVESLRAIKELHQKYGHIQEVIIQPFEPKPGTSMGNFQRPSFASILKTVKLARRILPGVGVQVPPNLISNPEKQMKLLISAGMNDLGGISPLTPDYINPDNPWPELEKLRIAVSRAGGVLRERLPVYPQFVDDHWLSKEVKRVVYRNAARDGFRTEIR